jgi:hydrogenase/urease accessory protein HupE
MQFFKRLWPKTATGHAIKAALALTFGYIVASRAIDSGSNWQYVLTFVLAGIGINNGAIAIRKTFFKKRHNS